MAYMTHQDSQIEEDSEDILDQPYKVKKGPTTLSEFDRFAVVDSGASTSIFSAPQHSFENFRTTGTNIDTAKEGISLRSIGKGTLPIFVNGPRSRPNCLHTVELEVSNSLHAPAVRHDLFSVASAVDEYGLKVVFTKNSVEFYQDDCEIFTKENLQFSGPRRGPMWVLPYSLKNKADFPTALFGESEQDTTSDTNDLRVHRSVMRLHEQYAHASIDKLKGMAISGDLDGLSKETRRALLTTTKLPCRACAQGKMSRKRYTPQKMTPTNYRPFQTMSVDHCGPFPTMVHGHTYYTIFVCHSIDFSFLIKTSSVSAQSTIFSTESVLNFVEHRTKFKIENLRSDRFGFYIK